jgi:hypothetical protein
MAAIIAALPFVLLLVAYHELPRIPVMRSSRFLTAICDDIDPWKHANRGHMSAGVAMVGQPYRDALSDILALTVALNSRSSGDSDGNRHVLEHKVDGPALAQILGVLRSCSHSCIIRSLLIVP